MRKQDQMHKRVIEYISNNEIFYSYELMSFLKIEKESDRMLVSRVVKKCLKDRVIVSLGKVRNSYKYMRV